MADPTHIKDLTPDPTNRRDHNARNVGMIADALQKVGAARSIVIDEHDVVLAGNGVTEAAAQVGIVKTRVIETDGNEIVAVRRRGLTDEQKRLLAMYDNRTAELATWNLDQLAADAAAQVDLTPFWTDSEVAMLLGHAVDPSWQGMPEFHQPDNEAWRSVVVHFRSQADLDAFAQLVEQTLTEKTRFIWFPGVERQKVLGALQYRSSE